MKSIQRFLLSLSALMLFSGAALALPVSARDGQASLKNVAEADSTSTTGTETQTEIDNHAKDLAEQFKAQAKAAVADKKAQVKLRTQEERQKSCTARKSSLTKRMSKAVTQANKHKEVFDKIYTRVKDFYTTKQLNVTDYAALTAKVDTAQANAATSINTLQTLDVSVDCSSSTVADGVSAFQAAVGNTRDSLKAYRAALTDLIKALKGASTASDNSASNTAEQ